MEFRKGCIRLDAAWNPAHNRRTANSNDQISRAVGLIGWLMECQWCDVESSPGSTYRDVKAAQTLTRRTRHPILWNGLWNGDESTKMGRKQSKSGSISLTRLLRYDNGPGPIVSTVEKLTST